MFEKCDNLPNCLEGLLAEAKNGNQAAILALGGIHRTYGEGEVTSDSYQIPFVPCPLRRCERDRMVIFNDDGSVVTTDDGYPTECAQGHKTVTINPAPTDIVDRDPPEPPTPPLSVAG